MNIIKFPVIVCFIVAFAQVQIFGQKEGDTWVLGYYSLGDPNWSIMHLNFTGNQLKIEWHFEETMQMSETASNVCDEQGEAILWTNGMEIFGKHGISISDTIAFVNDPLGYWNWFYTEEYGPLGFPEFGGALILPVPDVLNQYSVIYHLAELSPEFTFEISKYYEARIELREDSIFDLLYMDSLIGIEHD